MKAVISKTGALKAFYYLMAVDGITDFEIDRFQEIGEEFYGQEFDAIRQQVIDECTTQIDSANMEDERYDIIQEGLDNALQDTQDSVEDGVVPRLLIWDMLTLAQCDNDLSKNEERLISHVARLLKEDKSIFLEMKQLVITANSVQKEQVLLENSSRPYVEIKPLVDEIQKRYKVIMDAAMTLIADDMVIDKKEKPEKEKQDNIIVNAGKAVEGAVGNFFGMVADATKKKELTLPGIYKPMNTVPRKDAKAFSMEFKGSHATLVYYPLAEDENIDFDSSLEMVYQDQELIESDAGNSKNGGRYLYTICEKAVEHYELKLYIQVANSTLFVNGQYESAELAINLAQYVVGSN